MESSHQVSNEDKATWQNVFSSATFSHFRIAQKTIAVKKEELAKTSPSTAENRMNRKMYSTKAPQHPSHDCHVFAAA